MPRQGLGTLGSRKFPHGVLRKFIRNVEEERLEIYLSPLGLNPLLINIVVTHFESEWDSLGLMSQCYDVVLGTRALGCVFSCKDAILVNPVTPMDRVARLGMVGCFCKGDKVCFKAEAELHPSQGDVLGVQPKGRSVGCHVVLSLGIRALSPQCCLAAFMGFLSAFFFYL